MGLSIERFINEMNKRIKDKQDAEDYLHKETRNFEDKMDTVRRFISRTSVEIASLNGTEFSTDIGTIVAELANMWGVEKDSLSVGLSSTIGYSSIKPTRDQLNRYLEEKSRNTYLKIRVLDNNSQDQKCLASIYTIFRLNTIQADGRPLIQHLRMSTKQCDAEEFEISADLDEDVNKIILPFKLGDLVTQTRNGIVPDNNVARAVIQAIEKYNSKDQDMEMSE